MTDDDYIKKAEQAKEAWSKLSTEGRWEEIRKKLNTAAWYAKDLARAMFYSTPDKKMNNSSDFNAIYFYARKASNIMEDIHWILKRKEADLKEIGRNDELDGISDILVLARLRDYKIELEKGKVIINCNIPDEWVAATNVDKPKKA